MEVSVSQRQQLGRGLSTVLTRYPLAAAIKVVAAERIYLGVAARWGRAPRCKAPILLQVLKKGPCEGLVQEFHR